MSSEGTWLGWRLRERGFRGTTCLLEDVDICAPSSPPPVRQHGGNGRDPCPDAGAEPGHDVEQTPELGRYPPPGSPRVAHAQQLGNAEGVSGRGGPWPPSYPPGSPLRGLQVSGHLAGLYHGGHWVSSWTNRGKVLGEGSLRASIVWQSGPGGSRGPPHRTTQDPKQPSFPQTLPRETQISLLGHQNQPGCSAHRGHWAPPKPRMETLSLQRGCESPGSAEGTGATGTGGRILVQSRGRSSASSRW